MVQYANDLILPRANNVQSIQRYVNETLYVKDGHYRQFITRFSQTITE
jgi:hypothetical protein